MVAASEYGIVALLIVVAALVAGAILLLTHLLGPRRHGAVKDSPYESGMEPVGDARRRFHVRFYIVAMLFLLFDVEIVFFYPWAVLFPRVAQAGGGAGQLGAAGPGAAFFLAEMLIFLGVLLVGYIYAWRKGVFQWD